MALLTASRTAQRVLEAEFIFNFDDTMVPAAGGTAKDFGKTNTASTVFEVINLPRDAVVVGGEWITDTAFDAATYTVSVGDADSGTRYINAQDLKGTGRTALTLTGYRHTTGKNVRVTVVAADTCTTGKASLRVLYVIEGRADEVYPS